MKPVFLNLPSLLSKNITIKTNIVTMNYINEAIAIVKKYNIDFSFLFNKPSFKWPKIYEAYTSNEKIRNGFKTIVTK